LNGREQNFFLFLDKLVHFQLQYFRRMIPQNFHELISTALSQHIYIKLLGSGGGGFLLAIARNRQQMEDFFRDYPFDITWL
jgi:mevalonate kinase